jgi:ssDNA-binding Zn-finger/Zn-ribbon topoisomerase 1
MTETNRANEMSNCPVSSQIADHVNEPDEEYCPKCESPMTEEHYAGAHWLGCDNQQCSHVIELGGQK